ncbi:hypothetical protein A4F85_04630 [Delftia sp. GW456-R20]|nr:hypothetical protein A4F85_04630 [Delftia sp. GW456-R20]
MPVLGEEAHSCALGLLRGWTMGTCAGASITMRARRPDFSTRVMRAAPMRAESPALSSIVRLLTAGTP